MRVTVTVLFTYHRVRVTVTVLFTYHRVRVTITALVTVYIIIIGRGREGLSQHWLLFT